MSAYKRLVALFALAALVVLGSTRAVNAQGHGGTHVVVSTGVYLSPPVVPRRRVRAGSGGMLYPPPPYPVYAADSSVRLEVTPKEAQVFVDGYYAGIVDDFDGAFQRLHTPPGAHEIELYMDGYHVARQRVFLPVNDTFKIKYQMVKLAPSDQPEPRPQPIAPPTAAEGGNPPPEGYAPQGGGYYPPQGYPPPQGQGQQAHQPGERRPRHHSSRRTRMRAARMAAYGTLSVRVQPGDAEVSIDGDQWRGPDQSDRLVVQVAEGSHTVEIRKTGYRTYVTQVDIHHGATTPLNVSLHTQDQQ